MQASRLSSVPRSHTKMEREPTDTHANMYEMVTNPVFYPKNTTHNLPDEERRMWLSCLKDTKLIKAEPPWRSLSRALEFSQC